MFNQNIKIPLYIGDEEIYTEERKEINQPHDNKQGVVSYSVCKYQHDDEPSNNYLSVKNEWNSSVV